MQVVYSIGGCKFGGSGIGNTSYHAVAGISRHKLLKQLIVSNYQETEIDENLITKIPSRLPGLRKLVDESWANVINDGLHAKLSSLVLKKGNLFHGWAGMSLEALKKAKNLRMITVLNRASSHILEAKEIIELEYQRWGIKISPYINWGIQRELQEYELVDYIFTPSPFARDSFLERGFTEDKLRMIPFGVEPISLSIPPILATPPADQKLNALFVGEVGFRKGILYALKAWQKADMNKGTFFVVGLIIDQIKPFLTEFRNDSTIEFTGYADAKKYFPQADIFIFPSLEEGSALVTYEAMAYGLPVITTYNAGSVITHDKDGLIIPVRDVDKIEEALHLLAKSPKLRTQMSQQAKNITQQYTWFNYGENVVKQFQSILGSTSTTSNIQC